MKYKIAVFWQECGTYEVEADSLDEAVEIVDNASPPYNSLPDGEYIDDSFEINMECTRELNQIQE